MKIKQEANPRDFATNASVGLLYIKYNEKAGGKTINNITMKKANFVMDPYKGNIIAVCPHNINETKRKDAGIVFRWDTEMKRIKQTNKRIVHIIVPIIVDV